MKNGVAVCKPFPVCRNVRNWSTKTGPCTAPDLAAAVFFRGLPAAGHEVFLPYSAAKHTLFTPRGGSPGKSEILRSGMPPPWQAHCP
ncbi:hypothetical protein CNY67_11485 [Desulfovibrio sp. G11]|nr:hypothetical protein CNY67_11485 [Desulfovibrio sp. G11]